MMKSTLKILIIILLMACNTNKNSFIITADTDRVGDAILLKIDPVESLIDTTNIKNGKFSFKKTILEEELYRLKFHDGSSFDILVDLGENIVINFQEDQLSIKGSSGTKKIMELDNNLLNLLNFRDSITQELQDLSDSEDYEEKVAMYREAFFDKLAIHQEYLKTFINDNKNSKVCLIALFQEYGQSSPVMTVDEHLEVFEMVLENLKTNFPNSNHVTLLEDQIELFRPLAYGQPAPDFTLPDQNNKSVSLSDFKNKVVLIDFWASWCKPCRMENPKLVKLYTKYSKKDFEIISVSLDGTARQKDSKSAWLKAIKDDNLSPWIHLSELKGWETYVRELYNFNSIPYTVLVDKEGKIVAKNLRGLDLELRIKKLIDG
ncbi:MAG: AhpC/TSA family protein [Flavobacteriales bacterium TMED191]|nr:MAG: AhpC/TSA family protein [Flavobacteriales bacterium TMED191]